MKNKEYGSDFHLVTNLSFLSENIEGAFFLEEGLSLFFSGRVALFNILENGIKKFNWTKVYVPSFYCHEVVHFINPLPIEVIYYDFNPFLDSEHKEFKWDDVPTTVVLNVLYYGIKKLDISRYKNLFQVEDLTHGILEYKESNADYCFGSLRKELPVPVGGFCVSPKNRPLPAGARSLESEQVSIQKLAAMYLKGKYLVGDFDNKNDIRKLFIDAENKLEFQFTNAIIPETSKGILSQLNCMKILEEKYQNIKQALSLLKKSASLDFNMNSQENNVFGLVINCKNEIIQSDLKHFLISRNIYPAVLWPNQLTQRDINIEKKILFVHLDYRYDRDDIILMINSINAF